MIKDNIIYMTDGKKANKNGKHAETFVACMLKENGISFKKKCVVGTTLYGTELIPDFILPDHMILIDVKWQQTGGSADEKYPFLVANLKRQDNYRSIIVVDGGGAREKTISWMRDQIDDKLIGVMSITEFVTFLNNGGLNART